MVTIDGACFVLAIVRVNAMVTPFVCYRTRQRASEDMTKYPGEYVLICIDRDPGDED
jgi:hypothetical protein